MLRSVVLGLCAQIGVQWGQQLGMCSGRDVSELLIDYGHEQCLHLSLVSKPVGVSRVSALSEYSLVRLDGFSPFERPERESALPSPVASAAVLNQYAQSVSAVVIVAVR